eukprot:c15556_g1_i1.p1 GENE.c15556_g1_i1~~c15556_g1_i1.p1  ORF type:complete len:582 (-),score=184.63 c15556_g1_i1:161-1906(-)
MATQVIPQAQLPVSASSFSVPVSPSLYVGDLQHDVTEALLFEIFSNVGPVSSIRVCRDSVTRRSLGYAYVNFHSVADAERALDTLNFHAIKGFPCRVMWSHRDPSVRRNASGNLFVKNLAPTIDHKALYDIFSPFGSILSCKVAIDADLKSKGFGFVHFATEESAEKAIEKVNDETFEGLKVFVGKFERRQDRTGGRFTNVYVKNIPKTWTKNKFQQEFEKFGKITSLCLPSNSENEDDHKGFGYVNYSSHEEALNAVQEGKNISTDNGVSLFVDRFQKSSERKAFLERVSQNIRRERAEKTKNLNLYVKNLDDDVDDERLREMFSEYGQITSVVVMRDPRNQVSRGFGFVCFATEADAEKALNGMRLKPVGKKPLFVARAQRKEERRILLENEFQTSMVQRMQYSQLFYPPAVVAQPGMYYPQMYPRRMHQQMPIRAGAYPPQAAVAAYPAQLKPRGRGGYFPPTRGAMSQNRSSNTRNRVNQPRNHQPPVTPAPIVPQSSQQGRDLTSILAAETSPERQKNILGERLFPLVQKEHPQLAGKITGMLLEMDVSEILNLLDSPTERLAKIQEALDVLNANQ